MGQHRHKTQDDGARKAEGGDDGSLGHVSGNPLHSA